MNAIDYGYTGQRVIVTGGGGSGMGAAAVDLLVAQGAEVHVLDLKEPSTEVASAQVVDLADPAAVTAAVGRIGGPVKALFNTAGVAGNRTSVAETMVINFASVRNVTETVLPLMGEGSSIVSVASQAGAQWMTRIPLWMELATTPDLAAASTWIEEHLEVISQVIPGLETGSAYSASKEALIVWTQYSAAVLCQRGIRNNVTLPGPTTTPMSADFDAIYGKAMMDGYPIPLGRPQTTLEQAHAALFLNSDLAGAITGALLATDGGVNAGLFTGVTTFAAPSR